MVMMEQTSRSEPSTFSSKVKTLVTENNPMMTEKGKQKYGHKGKF